MGKLILALACRNNGSRLYGKPLQNLCPDSGYTILDNIIASVAEIECVHECVLGIARGPDNEIFSHICADRSLKYVIGDEFNVLSRLIACGELSSATDILRITSESPFPCVDLIEEAWLMHNKNGADATFLDDVIDGCGFEIISLDALKTSQRLGSDRHRSELCSSYLRENKSKFSIQHIQPPSYLVRKDLRLTVDYPEDLVVCRAVFAAFRDQAPSIRLDDVVNFLDRNPELTKMVSCYCEQGYSTMYL